MPDKERGFVLPWWALIGGTTVLLVGYTSPWMRLHYRGLYRFKAWALNFNEEMTFGVWWTAALFLLGAALFYELSASGRKPLRRACLQLSLVLLAIVIDEIAALHEWVSGIGGWPALAPFGLVLLLLLGDSLRRLWAERQMRSVFWLLLAGFLLLGSVPIQEYAEHNLTTQRFSNLYGRFIEESTELAGALVILLAATYQRRGRWLAGFEAAVPDPVRMPRLLPILVAGFLVHLVALLAPLLDLGTWDGSTSAVYPFVAFFLLACYAYWTPFHRWRAGFRASEVRGFWAAAGTMFLACSIGAIQNLWGLVGGLVPGLRRDWFIQPVPTYVALILAAWLMGLTLYGPRNRRPLWLLALPLTIVVFYRIDPRFQMHLAAGLFALICAAAFLRLPRGHAAGEDGPTPLDGDSATGRLPSAPPRPAQPG
jgi:hypothetical protein